MPLDKLSKKQIKSAYKVLTELQQLIEQGGTPTQLLDASNHFYTVIPHDFGMKKPPLLDTADAIRIFKVSREGEAKVYEPFRDLHNRLLLWHGSRTTNFAGILSHGLRTAPPEAPAMGYKFGKGIYFADMVSKSANYCMSSKSNPVCLLLLFEVALGNMHELKHAQCVTKLPEDKHSTKGCGVTCPDPHGKYVMSGGVEMPMGKEKWSPDGRSTLLFNEYIVYDVAQVSIKYLLKMNFKHK